MKNINKQGKVKEYSSLKTNRLLLRRTNIINNSKVRTVAVVCNKTAFDFARLLTLFKVASVELSIYRFIDFI